VRGRRVAALPRKSANRDLPANRQAGIDDPRAQRDPSARRHGDSLPSFVWAGGMPTDLPGSTNRRPGSPLDRIVSCQRACGSRLESGRNCSSLLGWQIDGRASTGRWFSARATCTSISSSRSRFGARLPKLLPLFRERVLPQDIGSLRRSHSTCNTCR